MSSHLQPTTGVWGADREGGQHLQAAGTGAGAAGAVPTLISQPGVGGNVGLCLLFAFLILTSRCACTGRGAPSAHWR